jgi:hypothetical protein
MKPMDGLGQSEPLSQSEHIKNFQLHKFPMPLTIVMPPPSPNSTMIAEITFSLLHRRSIGGRRQSWDCFRDWTYGIPWTVKAHRDLGMNFTAMNCGLPGVVWGTEDWVYRESPSLLRYLHDMFDNVIDDHLAVIDKDPKAKPVYHKTLEKEREGLLVIGRNLGILNYQGLEKKARHLWSQEFFNDLCWRWVESRGLAKAPGVPWDQDLPEEALRTLTGRRGEG